jgi:MSHA pilin protein MshA
LHGAASLAHAKSLVEANSTSITVEGDTVTLVNGYPSANGTGIVNMLQDVSGFSNNTAGSSIDFWPNGVTTPADCQVTYTEAGPGGDAPDISISATNCN